MATNSTKRLFKRAERSQYSNEEKLELGKLVEKFKEEYDAEVKKNQGKTKYDAKRKRHVPIKPTTGYVAKAVRFFYTDLVDTKGDDPEFVKALKLASRSYNELERLQDPSSCPPKKSRGAGAGRKVKAAEVRVALFNWFVDVRESLKGRLPRRLFKLKAQQLYGEWLIQNPVPEQEKLKFSNKWIKSWENEYGVSLRKPNKRYSIKREDLLIRLRDYLQNVWAVRRFFIEKYGVDPPIINGDQMPLHRNESTQEKTMTFKGEDTFVKENHNLSRERVTVFTQVTSVSNIKLQPEFVFKGKGVRAKVAVDNVNYQWSPSGSYRLEHMIKTINNLPNRFNPFTQKNFAIYVLDDYAVHLMPEVRKALYQRGYILIVMGGGITGFIQANDTDLHRRLKALYRHEEMDLMLKMLEVDKNKVPSPKREDMVKMLLSAWRDVPDNFAEVFKKLFVTSALDGSEDHLVSDKLFALIGSDMQTFRKKLTESPVPANLQSVIKNLIPPKGIRRNNEGLELLDYVEDDPFLFEDEDSNETDGTSDESDGEQNDAETQHEIPSTVGVEATANPSNTIPSLANVSDDPLINKDAMFLDALQKVFEENETSVIFKPHLKKMKSAFYEARKGIKKRIKEAHNNTVVEQEDEGNIFDIIQNM